MCSAVRYTTGRCEKAPQNGTTALTEGLPGMPRPPDPRGRHPFVGATLTRAIRELLRYKHWHETLPIILMTLYSPSGYI